MSRKPIPSAKTSDRRNSRCRLAGHRSVVHLQVALCQARERRAFASPTCPGEFMEHAFGSWAEASRHCGHPCTRSASLKLFASRRSSVEEKQGSKSEYQRDSSTTFSTTLLAGVAPRLSAVQAGLRLNPSSCPQCRPGPWCICDVFLLGRKSLDSSACRLRATGCQNPLTSLADDVAATRRILGCRRAEVSYATLGRNVISGWGRSPSQRLVYSISRAGCRRDYAALAAKFPTHRRTPAGQSGRLRQLSEEASSRLRGRC